MNFIVNACSTCLTPLARLLARSVPREKTSHRISHFFFPSLPQSYCTRITELLKFIVHEKDESKYFDIRYEKCQEKCLAMQGRVPFSLSLDFPPLYYIVQEKRTLDRDVKSILTGAEKFRIRYSKHVKGIRAIRSNSRNWKRT